MPIFPALVVIGCIAGTIYDIHRTRANLEKKYEDYDKRDHSPTSLALWFALLILCYFTLPRIIRYIINLIKG